MIVSCRLVELCKNFSLAFEFYASFSRSHFFFWFPIFFSFLIFFRIFFFTSACCSPVFPRSVDGRRRRGKCRINLS